MCFHNVRVQVGATREQIRATVAEVQGQRSAVLTVVAVAPRVGRHGAVAGEVLPLLDAHAHVGARVLLAGGARAYREKEYTKETRRYGGRAFRQE